MSAASPRNPAHAQADAPSASAAGDVEAVLMSTDKPVSAKRIAAAIGLPENDEGETQVSEAVDRLNASYEASGRSFRIERLAGGLRIMTLPEHTDAVAAFHDLGSGGRLSRAALETLSIVAYRQPITRADLESIRGVGCGEVLRSLLERKLVDVAGRAEELGRPLLYKTTPRFLEAFGLSSLKDLPSVDDLVEAEDSE